MCICWSRYQPLGGVLISDRLLADVSGDDNAGAKWQVGYTYSGHPCACAAGIANLELMEETEILSHVQEVGPAFQVSFQWKNPDFLFRNPDLLIRNSDFLLKDIDFIIKTGRAEDSRGPAADPGDTWRHADGWDRVG